MSQKTEFYRIVNLYTGAPPALGNLSIFWSFLKWDQAIARHVYWKISPNITQFRLGYLGPVQNLLGDHFQLKNYNLNALIIALIR